MKKTLIALAAVAVSGAAFAQATITGGFAYGYQSTKTNTYDKVTKVLDKTGVKANGLGVDTAGITIAASEDLGGGLKAAASMSVGGFSRGNTVGGENFAMSLSGGFGTVGLSSVESGSGIRPLGSAGAPVTNMEGEVLSPAANVDILSYTAPAMGPFTIGFTAVDATGTGLGVGRSATDASSVGASLKYSAGALSVALDYGDWNNKAVTAAVDNRTRLSAKYDAGMLAVGAGWDSRNLVGGGTNVQTIVGVSVPMGALTVGAVSVRNKTQNSKDYVVGTTANVAAATLNVTKSGTSVGASYALSKRTSVTASVANWKVTGEAGQNSTTVLLNHSF
jgi:hypothetical protein